MLMLCGMNPLPDILLSAGLLKVLRTIQVKSSQFKSWRYSEKEAAEVISREIVSGVRYDGINYIVCKNIMAEPVILADGSVAKQSVQPRPFLQ